MTEGLLIGPDTTVREAIDRFPGIKEIFDKYGLADWDGSAVPVEAIGPYARLHQVDPPQLLRDLNRFAAGERHKPAAASLPLLEKRPDRGLQPYVLGALTALLLAVLAGFPLGILVAYSGARDIGLGVRWTPLIQAHGHLQVMGWLGMFLVGVALQVVPRFKQVPLRLPVLVRPAIALLAGGLIARTVSQPYADGQPAAAIMWASAGVEALGVAAFVAAITTTLMSARRKYYDWYLFSACAWLAASAVANVVVVGEIAADQQAVIPGVKNDALITMQLFGFVALFIFGVSIRILPHFLSLRPPSVAWLLPALFLYNAGLIVRVGSGWVAAYADWTRPDELHAVSAYAMAGGVLLLLLALKLHLPGLPKDTGEVDRGHMKVIRTAYAWLAVAFAIEVWFATRSLGTWNPDFFEAGVVRHALALGFATQMVMGVARRLLPALAERPVRSRLALDISFWLLNVAIVTRVLYAPFGGGSALVRYDHIAWSGVTAVIALILFVYGMARSMMGPPAVERRGPSAPQAQVSPG
ncbi:MAG TPA: NnrS family protein [Dehalococcoidia bacterium]|nr:NnrS family protein [Dehalococcoidia bacterium]